jgi:hypothetical protein
VLRDLARAVRDLARRRRRRARLAPFLTPGCPRVNENRHRFFLPVAQIAAYTPEQVPAHEEGVMSTAPESQLPRLLDLVRQTALAHYGTAPAAERCVRWTLRYVLLVRCRRASTASSTLSVS